MTRILVTSVGGDVACAALRCLLDMKEEIYIIGCDIQPYCQGRMYADEFLIAPRYSDEDAYKAWVLDTCREKKVDILLPIGEREIVIAAGMRTELEAAGVGLMVVNDSIISIGTDKYETYLACKALGVRVPATELLSEADKCLTVAAGDAASGPADGLTFGEGGVVIKKRTGSGAKGLIKAATADEAKIAAAEIAEKGIPSDWVIQQAVGSSDEEYTMGVFSDGENVSSVTFRRRLGFGSMSVYVETVDYPETQEIAEKLAKGLGLVGSMNVQMRRDEEGFAVFEINPRLSSSCAFRHKMGFTDAKWWMRLMLGERPDISYAAEPGVVGIKTLDEMIFSSAPQV